MTMMTIYSNIDEGDDTNWDDDDGDGVVGVREGYSPNGMTSHPLHWSPISSTLHKHY